MTSDRIFTILSSTWCWVLTQSYHWISSKLHTLYLDSPPTCLHLIFLHQKSNNSKSYPMTLKQLPKHHWSRLKSKAAFEQQFQHRLWRDKYKTGDLVLIWNSRVEKELDWKTKPDILDHSKFMTHTRWILHSQGNGWHGILTWSCSIPTFTLSCLRRHSSSHWWLTFGQLRWFRWRVLTGDSQIFSTGWISHIISVNIIHL